MQDTPPISPAKARLCKAGGFVLFALGFAGIFLPLLPTVIFWILAAWAFTHAHPEMRERIFNWPRVGRIVRDFVERGVITRGSKISAITGITLVGGLSLVLTGAGLAAAAITGGIFLAVIAYIITRPEA